MDRNTLAENPMISVDKVALRKESVDRNLYLSSFALVLVVALRKESVDRNVRCSLIVDCTVCVALRKESVDRNRVPYRLKVTKTKRRSPQGERG